MRSKWLLSVTCHLESGPVGDVPLGKCGVKGKLVLYWQWEYASCFYDKHCYTEPFVFLTVVNLEVNIYSQDMGCIMDELEMFTGHDVRNACIHTYYTCLKFIRVYREWFHSRHIGIRLRYCYWKLGKQSQIVWSTTLHDRFMKKVLGEFSWWAYIQTPS